MVGIFGGGQHVSSDSAGRFRLTEVRFGSQRVEVRAIGYQPSAHAVTVVPGEVTRIELRLKPAVVNLPEVVVSTSREEQLASSTAGQRRRDSRARRSARPAGHHPSEIVNRTPGVYVSNFGGEGHATAIRQPITTKALYAYLEDGVPIRSTGFFNHNALYEINIPQAGRLEVHQGAGHGGVRQRRGGRGGERLHPRSVAARPRPRSSSRAAAAPIVRGLGTASCDLRAQRVPRRPERHQRRRLAG